MGLLIHQSTFGVNYQHSNVQYISNRQNIVSHYSLQLSLTVFLVSALEFQLSPYKGLSGSI